MILVLLSILPAVPLTPLLGHYQSGQLTHSLPLIPGHDPNGTAMAFNATRAQFDLYTETTASPIGTAPPVWFSNTFNSSQTGAPVTGTSFNVTIPSSTAATENVTWNNIIVPKGNFSSTTYLRFDWRGLLTNQTKASYFVYNMTGHPAIYTSSTKLNITGGPPNITNGSPPVGCGPNDNCFDVSKYIGLNLTLTFRFDTNSTGKGLNVNVNNIALASADALPINSYSHSMRLDPTDLTGMTVNHNADLFISPPGYFANVTYPRPNAAPGKLNHTWSQMILSYYFPNSYTSVKVAQNGTNIFPTVAPASPIFQGNCPSFFFCRDTRLISLNMTSGIKRALIIITANSTNLGAKVETTLGGVPTSTWGPGDLLQVRVTLRQGVNVTGSDYVTANMTSTRLTQTFTNTREGISLLNFTTPIPQGPSLFGLWTVNSTFTNMYDFGYTTTSFTLQQLGVTGFTFSGSNQQLTARGTLTYLPANPSTINVNGYVFAIDNGAEPAALSTPTSMSSSGIYVSNVSLVNGIFTQGQQLMIFFTLVNSGFSSQTKINSNANLTIDHEFVSGQTHDSNVTIPLPSGYDTFTLNSKYVYQLNATFTPAGIRVVVRGLTAGGSSISGMLPPGNPPVTSLRQHAGLFKITVTSTPLSGSGACVPSCSHSLESPAYAYVLVNPPVPGRLLASGSFSSLSTTGSYSTIITGRILGATRLSFLTLGIDPTGFAVTIQGQSSQESTLLQSTLDHIPSATQNQPLTLVLHLKSNATTVIMNLSTTVNIQDSTGATKVTQSMPGVTVSPGQTQDVKFNINAPGNVGTYTVTFLSADYGAPLITGTLQVSVLQSNLQVLIPAIIGVAAAIVILLFFLFRKKPIPTPEPAIKEKPTRGKPKSNPGTSTSKSLT